MGASPTACLFSLLFFLNKLPAVNIIPGIFVDISETRCVAILSPPNVFPSRQRSRPLAASNPELSKGRGKEGIRPSTGSGAAPGPPSRRVPAAGAAQGSRSQLETGVQIPISSLALGTGSGSLSPW